MSKIDVLALKDFVDEWASKPYKGTYRATITNPDTRPIRRLSMPLRSDKIRQVMEKGEPLIVEVDIAGTFSLEKFCTLYGHHTCYVERCDVTAKSGRKTSLKSYFSKEWKEPNHKVKVRSTAKIPSLFVYK